MKRRDFIKNTSIMGTAILAAPSLLSAKAQNPFNITDDVRIFSLKNSYNLPFSKETTRLWIPLPMDKPYHRLVKLSYNGNYKKAFIGYDNPYDTKALYVEFEGGSKQNKVDLFFDVAMQQRSVNLDAANGSTNYSKEVEVFLKGTPHVPVSNFLKEFVSDIVTEKMTPLEKARAIYDWTTENMYRDPDVIGCGLGDADRILREKAFGGKCTDISSVFVALCRNAGVPAREVFGLRAGQSKISNSCGKADEFGFALNTKWQHCRAEFYLNGCGWVPCDPADVTKVKLQEDLSSQSQKLKDVKEYFFGNWEMNWVGFNYARDFILNPKPTQFPLNMFNYPYAEAGEDVLNYYQPKEFGYSYTSQEVKK